MPRAARKAPGGQVYHVLNRSVDRVHLFGKNADFEAFQGVMIEAHQRHPIRILSYCVLSNHWHFVVWPEAEGQVSAFFRWLAHTHAMRWRVAHRTVGYGHIYQGRCSPMSPADHSAPPSARGSISVQARTRASQAIVSPVSSSTSQRVTSCAAIGSHRLRPVSM